MTKKHRFYIITGIFYGTMGLLGLLIRDDLIKYFNLLPIFASTIPVMLFLTGIGIVLFVYLQGGFSRENIFNSEMHDDYVRQIKRLQNDLVHKISEENKILIDDEKIKTIIDSKIEEISIESLFKLIKANFEDNPIHLKN